MITLIKKFMNILFYFSTFAFLYFSTFTVAWGDTQEELNRLNELKEQLKQERVSRVNDKVDNYNRLKLLEMEIYSLDDKLAELKTKNFDLEEELNSQQLELEKIQSEYDELSKKEKELENLIIGATSELKQRIENLPPHQKNARLKKVSSVKNLSQLFEYLKEEISYGESLKLYSGQINGENSKIMDIGGIFSVYKSADGKIGLLEKKIKKDKIICLWNENVNPGLKKKLEKIFELNEKEEKIIGIPIDVTQGTRMREIKMRTDLLGWFLKGGPVMIPIVVVTIGIIFMSIERLLVFRRECINADFLMDKVMELWSKGYKDDAIKLCEATPGPVARMLRIGLEQHQKGKEVVEEMLHQQHLEELPKLEKNLSTIAVLAGAAPLLGLLGTVSGMINTFHVITYYGGGDPRLLAGGISEALITTEFGLIVAIPTLILHNYLSNKADKIASDMEKNAVRLINSLPK